MGSSRGSSLEHLAQGRGQGSVYAAAIAGGSSGSGSRTYGGSFSFSGPIPLFYARDHCSEAQGNGYNSVSYHSVSGLGLPRSEYFFQPDVFLKLGHGGQFVGTAETIKPFVEEAFEALFNKSFPETIRVHVLPEPEFRAIAPHSETIGLSINRKLSSEIFVLQGSLGRVLLTVGHELGHVLTNPLEQPHDEEAKAYAFSVIWMNILKEHNIAGLGNSFVAELPAENGLHNVSFSFVQRMMQQGVSAWKLYRDIISNIVSVPSLMKTLD